MTRQQLYQSDDVAFREDWGDFDSEEPLVQLGRDADVGEDHNVPASWVAVEEAGTSKMGERAAHVLHHSDEVDAVVLDHRRGRLRSSGRW